MKIHSTLKTKIISLFLVLALFLTLAPSVFSVEVQATTGSQEDQIQPRIDETSWVFAELYGDGIIYKRLWSNTQGKWLTDWEPIGYV